MRTLVRWPVRDLTIAGLSLNPLLHILEDENLNGTTEPATAWVPSIEIHQTATHLVLRVEVPGVTAKDLDVQVSREAVTIAGEVRPTRQGSVEGRVRSEFRYGKFRRVVPLRIPVQPEGVVADLKDGILTLTLLKVMTPKVVKVSIQTPSEAPPEGDFVFASEAEIPTSDVSAPAVDVDLTEDLWATEPAIAS